MPLLDAILRFFGFAVCHTLPARTLALGGHYLPLCARCTGIYLGVAVSYVFLLSRRGFRVNALPHLPVSFILAGFLLPMAIDGVTSYAGLRPSTNEIRLLTGVLAGGAVPIFAFPLLAPELVLAERAGPKVRSFGRWFDYPIWLGMLGGAAAASLTTWPPFYYPLAVLSTLGLLGVFFNLALVCWEMALEKAGRWGRRPLTLIPAALTVALVFTLLHTFHAVAYRLMLNATGGKLPT